MEQDVLNKLTQIVKKNISFLAVFFIYLQA